MSGKGIHSIGIGDPGAVDTKYVSLIQDLKPEQIRMNEPLQNHTTFKIGGPADLFIRPASGADMQHIAEQCQKRRIDYLVIGNGSNLLFSDRGYRGVVIQILSNMSHVRVCPADDYPDNCPDNHPDDRPDRKIISEAGVTLAALAAAAYEAGLTGLEFASGIPGALGGGIAMNAGAYGGEMRDVFLEAEILLDGQIRTLARDEMAFAYRSSALQVNNGVLLSASLKLKTGARPAIKAQMDTLNARRREKQPLEWPSAGSAFKRPEGYFAGKLIMDSGLRGFSIGGAQVSEKHCGFIIN
ncbi:MAG: UDP-N-acetylmuramate dehydrogenase, partial [Clostridiales bacterium]|nr:UDP-N-acetylmuramate dehydrogenase [Clostridiales bacterium]